jgi:hypothetical protein
VADRKIYVEIELNERGAHSKLVQLDQATDALDQSARQAQGGVAGLGTSLSGAAQAAQQAASSASLVARNYKEFSSAAAQLRQQLGLTGSAATAAGTGLNSMASRTMMARSELFQMARAGVAAKNEIERAGGAAKLSTGKLAEMAQKVGQAVVAYEALGKTPPASLQRLLGHITKVHNENVKFEQGYTTLRNRLQNTGPVLDQTANRHKTLATAQGQLSNSTSMLNKGLMLGVTAGTFLGNALYDLGRGAVTFLIGTFFQAIDASSRFNNVFIGLGTVAKAFKQDANAAGEAARDLATDGLMSVSEAAQGLKNLLAAGFGLPEAIQLMKGFKDIAAFNRQASYEFGYAIVSATEGIKNQNSILVDNAGLTKNLSVIMREAGLQISDLARVSTDAAVRQKFFAGLMKEMSFSAGDAARLVETYSGAVSRLRTQWTLVLVGLGDAITQNKQVSEAVNQVSTSIAGLVEWIKENKEELAGWVSAGLQAAADVLSTLIGLTKDWLIPLGETVKLIGEPVWRDLQNIWASYKADVPAIVQHFRDLFTELKAIYDLLPLPDIWGEETLMQAIIGGLENSTGIRGLKEIATGLRWIRQELDFLSPYAKNPNILGDAGTPEDVARRNRPSADPDRNRAMELFFGGQGGSNAFTPGRDVAFWGPPDPEKPKPIPPSADAIKQLEQLRKKVKELDSAIVDSRSRGADLNKLVEEYGKKIREMVEATDKAKVKIPEMWTVILSELGRQEKTKLIDDQRLRRDKALAEWQQHLEDRGAITSQSFTREVEMINGYADEYRVKVNQLAKEGKLSLEEIQDEILVNQAKHYAERTKTAEAGLAAEKAVIAKAMKDEIRQYEHLRYTVPKLYDELVTAIKEKYRQIEEAAEHASKYQISQFAEDLGKLAELFQTLAEVSSGSFGQVAADIARVAQAMHIGAKAGMDLKQGWDTGNWGQIATGAAGAVGAMDAATSTQSRGKNILGGAATGAMIGGSIVPIYGHAVGAIVGGIIGAFRGAKQVTAEMRQEFLLMHGGLDTLKDKADLAGVSLDTAFQAKSAEDFEKAVDQINIKLAEYEQRLQAVAGASEGLLKRTTGFVDPFIKQADAADELKRQYDEAQKAYKDFVKANTDASGRMSSEARREAERMKKEINEIGLKYDQAMGQIRDAVIATGDEFDRVGQMAVYHFGTVLKMTGSLLEAFRQVGPSLDLLVAAQQRAGFKASETVQKLLDIQKVVKANEDVMLSIEGIVQLYEATEKAGMGSRTLFDLLSKDVAGLYDTLIRRGVDANTALLLVQPALQMIYEGQKKYGLVTDEATAKLIEQARMQGLVGDHMRDVNERILSVLLAIAKVLGADIPEGLETSASASETAAQRAVTAWEEARQAAIRYGMTVAEQPPPPPPQIYVPPGYPTGPPPNIPPPTTTPPPTGQPGTQPPGPGRYAEGGLVVSMEKWKAARKNSGEVPIIAHEGEYVVSRTGVANTPPEALDHINKGKWDTAKRYATGGLISTGISLPSGTIPFIPSKEVLQHLARNRAVEVIKGTGTAGPVYAPPDMETRQSRETKAVDNRQHTTRITTRREHPGSGGRLPSGGSTNVNINMNVSTIDRRGFEDPKVIDPLLNALTNKVSTGDKVSVRFVGAQDNARRFRIKRRTS